MNGVSEEKCIQDIIDKWDHMYISWVIVDIFVKKRQEPTDLTIHPEKSQTSVDEHSFDLITAKDDKIKNRVDNDG